MRRITIESPDDPRITAYRGVRDAHLRQIAWTASDGARTGLFMAEGEVVVRQLIASSYEVDSVLVSPQRETTMADALERLTTDTPVFVAAQAVMDEIAGFHIHRGILAAGRRRPLPGFLTICKQARLIVIAEDLANHDNMGSVFRNAAAFGADAVLLSPRAVDPLYRKALRVSAGHVLSVPYAVLDPWPDGLDVLRGLGWTLAALTTDGEPIGRAESGGGPVALLLGPEGPGLSETALAITDARLRIPIAAGVDSLNAGVAVGIALFSIAGGQTEQ